jgi:bifunctional N-acetylglucosamine-1-phosphate-uridyltransferase/glucosamine-1-phosphate-acetyltransferase GlmU-like protein
MTARLPRDLDWSNYTEYASPRVDRSQWTAVIAAAGKGSRLGFDQPKILYPVAGRTILAWLLDLLLPYCETVVLVLSPDGRAQVEPALDRMAPGSYRIAIQQTPTGMGDAVEVGLREVTTPHTAVLWGDQVALLTASVEAVLRLHEGPLVPDLTIPTVFRPNPYIHFERDATGAITRVLQAREGDRMPAHGESDTGFFCFRTDVLRTLLAELRASAGAVGARTGEFNLLPAISRAARTSHRVLTPHLMTLEETVGINQPSDAQLVEAFLRSKHA